MVTEGTQHCKNISYIQAEIVRERASKSKSDSPLENTWAFLTIFINEKSPYVIDISCQTKTAKVFPVCGPWTSINSGCRVNRWACGQVSQFFCALVSSYVKWEQWSITLGLAWNCFWKKVRKDGSGTPATGNMLLDNITYQPLTIFALLVQSVSFLKKFKQWVWVYNTVDSFPGMLRNVGKNILYDALRF